MGKQEKAQQQEREESTRLLQAQDRSNQASEKEPLSTYVSRKLEEEQQSSRKRGC